MHITIAKCESLFALNLGLSRMLKNDLKEPMEKYRRSNLEKGILSGIFSASHVRDRQGDITTNAELEKAAYDFMLRGQRGLTFIKGGKKGFSHKKQIDAYVVESWIEVDKTRLNEAGEPCLLWKGSVKINDPEVREEAKKGNIVGFSIGGYHFRVPRTA
jgi:hypothetical protein